MSYRRVVIKLSGAALSGPEPVGLDARAAMRAIVAGDAVGTKIT